MHQVVQTFFSPHDFRVAFPNVWAGFQVNLKLMVVAEALVLVFASRSPSSVVSQGAERSRSAP